MRYSFLILSISIALLLSGCSTKNEDKKAAENPTIQTSSQNNIQAKTEQADQNTSSNTNSQQQTTTQTSTDSVKDTKKPIILKVTGVEVTTDNGRRIVAIDIYGAGTNGELYPEPNFRGIPIKLNFHFQTGDYVTRGGLQKGKARCVLNIDAQPKGVPVTTEIYLDSPDYSGHIQTTFTP